ncbi:hypothetical protein ACIQZG_07295 [Lysinibacillus sp. NPDC096418]|uniref:hypothetical protein n=1 Tax=Lysinibacillus sp. NPDC096418 TaxID=3364138 RepID=UPI0037FE8754
MKKQIKESIDELNQQQLHQENFVKSTKQSRTLPIIATLFLSATIVMFIVTLLPKGADFQNEVAISIDNNLDTNLIQEAMQGYKEEAVMVKKNGTVIFYDEGDIQYLEGMFQQAEQIPGIVNMATPQYKVRLGEDGELFFLWFNEDHSATLMKSEVTHTIYKIQSAEKIEKMLQERLALA